MLLDSTGHESALRQEDGQEELVKYLYRSLSTTLWAEQNELKMFSQKWQIKEPFLWILHKLNMNKMNPISGPFFIFISLKNISTHRNHAGKTKSRMPQVLLFAPFWNGKRLNPKNVCMPPPCLNKASTSKPLQCLCSVLQNHDLRGEKMGAVARKGCPQREESSGSCLTHGIHEMKVSIWAPHTRCGGSLVPACWRWLPKTRVLSKSLQEQEMCPLSHLWELLPCPAQAREQI